MKVRRALFCVSSLALLSCSPRRVVPEADPIQSPSQFAWTNLATYSKADSTDATLAGWERWVRADLLVKAQETDCSTPQPVNPDVPLPPSRELRGVLDIGPAAPDATSWPNNRKRSPAHILRPRAGGGFAPAMEVRLNPTLCKAIFDARLNLPAEGANYSFHKRSDVTFPDGSVAIKAIWSEDSAVPCDPNIFHCYKDGKTGYRQMLGLHMAVKHRKTPDWFWATWEHESVINSDKYLENGLCCRDDFGFSGSICCKDNPFPVKDNGAATDPLKQLIGYAGAGKEWLHYRLVGTESTYLEANVPALLGNTQIESPKYAASSSCITCHARATASDLTSGGTSMSAFVADPDGPVLCQDDDGATCQCRNPTGIPDPDWYRDRNGTRTHVRLGFLWSLTTGSDKVCLAKQAPPCR